MKLLDNIPNPFTKNVALESKIG